MTTQDKPSTVEPKRPGRKPKGKRALTGAEKTAAYRARQQQRALEAVTSPNDATRVTLLETLAMCLEKLDNYTGSSKIVRSNMRGGAENAIRELVTRYELKV